MASSAPYVPLRWSQGTIQCGSYWSINVGVDPVFGNSPVDTNVPLEKFEARHMELMQHIIPSHCMRDGGSVLVYNLVNNN